MKKRVLEFCLVIFAILCMSFMCASAEVVSMTQDEYNSKVNSFIYDGRWANGTSWGGGQTPKLSPWSSLGCHAYASDFTYYMFGHTAAQHGDQFYDVSEIRAGDVIINDSIPHTVVVLGRSGNNLWTAEANWGSAVRITDSAYYISGNTVLCNGWSAFSLSRAYHHCTVNSIPPIVNDFYVSSATGDGFTVSANLGGGISSVWLNIYGPSGSNGYRVSASSGSFSHYIKYSDYGGYGQYSVHLYAENSSGEQVAKGLNNIYPSDNFGSEFYGIILNLKCWKPIEVCDDNYVRLATETGVARQVWKFVRESNGSYKIISAQNGKVLDVETAGDVDGLSVHTYEDVSGSNQRWTFAEQNGGFLFRPCNSGSRVLDMNGNNTSDGTKIQIWEKNNTDAQIFQIYTGKEVQLKSPTLSATAGTSTSNTIFNWNEVYGEKRYDVKIWNGTYRVGDSYHIEWGAKKPYSIKLPAGHYEAYVDASNELLCKMSNVVTFDVAEDNSDINIFSRKTVTDTGYNIHADIKYLNQSAVYAAALYTSDGRLLDVQTAPVASGATSADVAFSKQDGAAYFKVFLWDNLKSMQPLTESERINV
ncbi:MAG: RICIN domain-containing protein [Clostridia bacterium]|nr:RICIN domain-containing protein [Clostridia bacterium]